MMSTKSLKILLGFCIGLALILGLAFYLALSSIQEKSAIILDLVIEKEERKKEVEFGQNRIDYLNQEIQKLGGYKLLELEYERKGYDLKITAPYSKITSQLIDLPVNTVVFYFSKNHCSSCYENELKIINDYYSANPQAKLIILTSVDNDKQLELLKSTYKITLPLYRVTNFEAIDLPSYPTYFSVDRDEELRHFMIANENSPELSKKFIHFINRKK